MNSYQIVTKAVRGYPDKPNDDIIYMYDYKGEPIAVASAELLLAAIERRND